MAAAFIVATEACLATLGWTGAEASFPAGFPALDPSHIIVQYTLAGVTSTLVAGVNYTVSVDAATGMVTVLPVGGGMPATGGVLSITRATPAVQATQFNNLGTFSPDTHTLLHDAAALRDAELKRRIAALEALLSFPVIPASFAGVLGGAAFQTILTAAGPYAAKLTDREIFVKLNAAMVINMPTGASAFAAAVDGYPVTIKDIGGFADAQNITINFSDLCDTRAALMINTKYGGWRVRPIRTGGWTIV